MEYMWLVLIWTLAVTIWFFLDYQDGKCLPPGPLRLPLIGNMIQIFLGHPVLTYVSFYELSRKYGGLMRLKVGLQDVVVVSDMEIMQDMLVKDHFSGRHFEGYMKARSYGKELGVVFTSGELWRTIRRFTVRNLREFGFGRRGSMESAISLEVDNFVKNLNDVVVKQNGIIHVDRLFHLSLLNILWSMLGGKSFSYKDPKLLHLLKLNEDLMKTGNFGANLAFAFPFLTLLFPNWTGYNLQLKINSTFQDFIKGVFSEHRKRENYDTQPQSFIDVCLTEIDKNKEGQDKDTVLTEEQLIITVMDLFQVGSETTGNTLIFAIIFLILNPGVQQKVYNEINSKFPHGKFPTYEDRKILPYTEATVMEVLRLGNVVPIPPPRKSMANAHYRNYLFPKNTTVTMNFYGALMNKEFWGDPHNFRPERFLDPSPKVSQKKGMVEQIFGFGKRICLGETLAQTSIFLYFTAMIQSFSFHKVPGEPGPSSTPIPGFILSPKSFNAFARRRRQENNYNNVIAKNKV